MIQKEEKRDILDVYQEISKFHPVVILHGCNCFHTMGAGIAAYLSNKFPSILDADKQTPHGDRSKLGTYSFSTISESLTIINCYTQYGYGYGYRHVDIPSIESCLQSVCEDFPDHFVLMPRIGCGLAGGDWKVIKESINTILADRPAIVCFK